jgi:hypothetical protein
MSFVAVAIGGSAVLGYASSRSATKAASAAADKSVDAANYAAELQFDLGKQTLDFQKEYYQNTLAPMQKRDLELREQLQGELLPSMRQQREFAQEQNEFYKDTFQPVERRMVQEAQEFDSDANVNRRMGIAAANVNQQFSNAQQQGSRALSRLGLNPNSSAFARENARLMSAQALGTAGAQTGAAFDTMDRGIALRAGAANFGRNMPNTAANFYAGANQGAQTSGSISAQGMGVATNAVAPMLDGSRVASGAFNSGGGILNQSFQNRMAMFDSAQRGAAGLFQGIGTLAASPAGSQALSTFGTRLSGLFAADGGHITGPGGPRDDAIGPVYLSDGEFVLNEGAVKHFGLSRLNKMNEVGLKNQEARGLIRSSK